MEYNKLDDDELLRFSRSLFRANAFTLDTILPLLTSPARLSHGGLVFWVHSVSKVQYFPTFSDP